MIMHNNEFNSQHYEINKRIICAILLNIHQVHFQTDTERGNCFFLQVFNANLKHLQSSFLYQGHEIGLNQQNYRLLTNTRKKGIKLFCINTLKKMDWTKALD